MSRIFLLLSVFVLLGACSSHEKIRKKNVIPQNDLVSILEDLHMANSMFSLSYLREKYPGTDSISNYRDIFARYGYTLKDFNNTVTYYTDHLEEYVKIYDQVVKDLNEREGKIEEMPPEGTGKHFRKENLWNMNTEWHLPREGQRYKIPFSIPVAGPGVYTLSMRIRIGKNDGSVRPAITVYFWYDDGTDEGRKISRERKKLDKDGKIKQYMLAKKLTDPKVTHIKGFLLDDRNKDTLYIKHADVTDIKLDVKPLQELADSIK